MSEPLPTLPPELLTWGFYLDDKGYPQFTSGPYRKKRIHRVVMELAIGRPLRRDKVVDHRDQDRTNLGWHMDGGWNLRLLGEREHNAISAKQLHYMKTHGLVMSEAEWTRQCEEAAFVPFEGQF